MHFEQQKSRPGGEGGWYATYILCLYVSSFAVMQPSENSAEQASSFVVIYNSTIFMAAPPLTCYLYIPVLYRHKHPAFAKWQSIPLRLPAAPTQ